MPWTEITRAHYRRDGLRYASDLTDEEWSLIEPFMPAPKRRGRPRERSLREVVSALLYMASTGCQWRPNPHRFPAIFITGGCRCGLVRYVIAGMPKRHSLCWCADCRRSSGAPMVGWAVVAAEALRVTGEVAVFNSSGDVERSFCPRCGTGLFYRSETLFPGSVDVQSGTFDDPDILPLTVSIQAAEAPSWMAAITALPRHWRWSTGSVDRESEGQ